MRRSAKTLFFIPGQGSLTDCAAVFLTAAFLCVQAARAGNLTSVPGASAADQEQTLKELDDMLNEDIATTRKMCALGQAPGWVSAKRARYGSAVPFADASDMCVGVLGSIAERGHLSDLYREFLITMGGDAAAYERWPRVIGNAVLNDATKVAIGKNKVADVTPALAFDAGFTVAYEDGKAAKDQTADAAALKALTEACLGQHQDAGTCFSVGYVYGVHAYKTPTAASR